jgi:hypothetical protein
MGLYEEGVSSAEALSSGRAALAAGGGVGGREETGSGDADGRAGIAGGVGGRVPVVPEAGGGGGRLLAPSGARAACACVAGRGMGLVTRSVSSSSESVDPAGAAASEGFSRASTSDGTL